MQPSIALYLFSAAVIHIQHGHVHVQLYYITMSLCHYATLSHLLSILIGQPVICTLCIMVFEIIAYTKMVQIRFMTN